MTTQFQQERYQSDRLTFERQQFEEACIRYVQDDSIKEIILGKKDGLYIFAHTGVLWRGWQLAKGLL